MVGGGVRCKVGDGRANPARAGITGVFFHYEQAHVVALCPFVWFVPHQSTRLVLWGTSLVSIVHCLFHDDGLSCATPDLYFCFLPTLGIFMKMVRRVA